MKTFYLTFGQKSPLRDGWIEVEAEDYETARDEVFYVFGNKWSMLYPEEKFNREYFPAGKIAKTLVAPPQSKE